MFVSATPQSTRSGCGFLSAKVPFVVGDAEIDTTKVDSTRCMYDYDGETQGAIRKILFDEDQKRKGLPTSDELQSEDMLRKAWDAEGSPFRGTPFDPSKVDFRRGPNGP